MKMGKSCAEDAYGWQGVKTDDFGNVTDDSFPGHDNYQNGVIPNGSDSTIYCTSWYDGQPGSGYFTDQGTVDSCTHGGVLNSNELGEALQTAPSNYGTDGGDYQHKPNCTAYDIDWNRLDELKNENTDLYGRLTNPDGMSPDNNGIKCAYGRAEANPQYGIGQGNQYYIDKDTFNNAREAGVFKENPDKSFSEVKGNLTRQDIPNDVSYENKLASAKGEVMAAEDEKQLPTPDQTNSYEVKAEPDKPFMSQPDSAYGYGQGKNYQENNPIPNSAGNETDNALNSNNINAPPAQCQKNDGQLQSGRSQQERFRQGDRQSQGEQSQQGNIQRNEGQSQSGQSVQESKLQSQQSNQNQSSDQTSGVSSGMSTTAANTDQTASGSEKQNSSDGMPTMAAGSNQSNSQIQKPSDGMSATATGQSGNDASSSSGRAQNFGQSM